MEHELFIPPDSLPPFEWAIPAIIVALICYGVVVIVERQAQKFKHKIVLEVVLPVDLDQLSPFMTGQWYAYVERHPIGRLDQPVLWFVGQGKTRQDALDAVIRTLKCELTDLEVIRVKPL